mmetsp:Transcript_26940/g.23801  ORF Transcript_26940/g.23801 Transcript_26940/m.23801 type:complete len:122 (-) Transcript_26940:115-480(-)
MVDPANDFDNIIKEGWLTKQSKFLKEWRKRWFVLTPTHLYSFKEEKKYKNPTEVIVLKDCTTVKSAEDEIHKENAFRIDSYNRVFYIIANSGADKEGWIGAIGKAMVKPSLRKDNDGDDDY